MGAILILTIAAIAIGSSFQFGYQTGVVNELQQPINNTFSQSSVDPNLIFTLITTGFTVGGLFGALLASTFANKFGRKNSLLLLSVPTIIGSILMLLAIKLNSFVIVIIGRIIIGFSSGSYTGIAPMYMSEIAPIEIRGAAGSISQLSTVIAILVAQVITLKQLMGTDNLWSYAMGLSLIPAMIQLISLPFCPESPIYSLFVKKNTTATEDSLRRLRGESKYQPEFNSLITEANRAIASKSMSIVELIKESRLRRALLTGIGLHFSMQLSGINAAIYYSNSVFENALPQDQKEQASYFTLGMGAVNVLVTAISTLIVDRAGRRSLMLFGMSGMLGTTILLTIAFNLTHHYQIAWMGNVSIVGIYLFVSFFATGPGSIPWFYISEIFTSEARAAAQTLCVGANWFCAVIVGLTFPYIQKALGDFSFLTFTVTLTCSVIFIFFCMPESRGRKPEEMQRLFMSSGFPPYEPFYNTLGEINVSAEDEVSNNVPPVGTSISFTTRSMLGNTNSTNRTAMINEDLSRIHE